MIKIKKGERVVASSKISSRQSIWDLWSEGSKIGYIKISVIPKVSKR